MHVTNTESRVLHYHLPADNVCRYGDDEVTSMITKKIMTIMFYLLL